VNNFVKIMTDQMRYIEGQVNNLERQAWHLDHAGNPIVASNLKNIAAQLMRYLEAMNDAISDKVRNDVRDADANSRAILETALVVSRLND
jgi:hypothetical protein